MVLLIPRRIKQIKDEGFREGFAEGFEEGREKGRKQGIEIGRVEGRKKGLEEGRKIGAKIAAKINAENERGRVRRLFALYDRGEITLDEFRAVLSDRSNGENGAD